MTSSKNHTLLNDGTGRDEPGRLCYAIIFA
jgi:hypothetical protein